MSKWDCFIFLHTFENKYSGGTIVCARSGTLATFDKSAIESEINSKQTIS